LLLLTGRCYERESLPFKTFDSLIDDLARRLRALPEVELVACLPADFGAVECLFPVLRGLAPSDPAPAAPENDALALRRRAFVALRELFRRLGRAHPVLLFIDDLQWSDDDSAPLFFELLRPPDPPHLLFVTCHRAGGATEDLPNGLRRLRSLECVRALPLDALSHDEALELARCLLPVAGDQLAEAISRESAGHPYFLHELVRHCQARPDGGDGSLTLDDAISARIGRLSLAAQRLLEVVAVAGRPLRLSEALRAADLKPLERTNLALLRHARLLRGDGAELAEAVETYHDRVRETVVGRLTRDALRECHARLARTIEATGNAEAEALAIHFQGAGHLDKAAHYAALAGDKAVAALAFELAARSYETALEWPEWPAVRRRELRRQRAEALANCGRCYDAATAYLGSIDPARPDEALSLRQRAGEQLFRSGRFDEALDVLRPVFAALLLHLSATPFVAAARTYLRRSWLAWSGYRFRARDARQFSADELARIDFGLSAGGVLTCYDYGAGCELVLQAVHYALRAGEANRVVWALVQETALCSWDSRLRSRVAALMPRVQALIQLNGAPSSLALAEGVQAIFHYASGNWRQAVEHCDAAMEIFAKLPGSHVESAQMSACRLGALFYLGRLAELSRRVQPLATDAIERNDLFSAMFVRIAHATTVWLMADSPAEARRELADAIAPWSQGRYCFQHAIALAAQAQIGLYDGNGGPEYAEFVRTWRLFRRSRNDRMQIYRIEALSLRARCALAAAGRGGPRARLLRAAQRDCRRLEAERLEWSRGLALLVRGAVAEAHCDVALAQRQYAQAEACFSACEMELHAAVARRRQGELQGGEMGQRAIDQADVWMTAEGIRNPSRMARMIAPRCGG